MQQRGVLGDHANLAAQALLRHSGDILIVAGYLDQGGSGVIRAALDTGAFSKFELPGGMIGDNLIKNIPTGLEGSFGQVPGSDAPGMKTLAEGVESEEEAATCIAMGVQLIQGYLTGRPIPVDAL